MTIAQSMMPEFDHEMANTRKMLERLPEDKLSFKPDPKSMDLGRLAGHVAEMPGWGSATLEMDVLDLQPGMESLTAKTRTQVLEAFDNNVKKSRAALLGASDEHLMKPWTLKFAGKEIFTMPRIAVLRSMVMNHTIHHRAQLGVYYRMNGVPIPGMYGPSADEPQGM